MSQKKFIDYIIKDRIKLLIDEFLEDLNSVETWDEIPWESYKQIDVLRKKWEAKKNKKKD